jgi:hypothetical protein
LKTKYQEEYLGLREKWSHGGKFEKVDMGYAYKPQGETINAHFG